jgi:hypothetical protein
MLDWSKSVYAHTGGRQVLVATTSCALVTIRASPRRRRIGKHEEKVLEKAFVHLVSIGSISHPTSSDILRTTSQYFWSSGFSLARKDCV